MYVSSAGRKRNTNKTDLAVELLATAAAFSVWLHCNSFEAVSLGDISRSDRFNAAETGLGKVREFGQCFRKVDYFYERKLLVSVPQYL